MLDVTNWPENRAHFVNAKDNSVLYLESAGDPVESHDETPNFHVVDLDSDTRNLTVAWDAEPEKFAGWLRRSATLSIDGVQPIQITAFSTDDPAKSKQIVSFLASIGEL